MNKKSWTGPIYASFLYWSAQVAITKHHRLSGFNPSNLFSYSYEGQKFKIEAWAGVVPPEGSLLGWQTATAFLRPQGALPLCLSVS